MLVTSILGLLLLPTVETGLTAGGSNVCSFRKSHSQKYYTRCGFLGWDSCSRHRTVYTVGQKCCEYWKTTSSSATVCTVPLCIGGWNICPNGGTCTTANHCDCPSGYFSPNCVQCTPIANCAIHECTSSSDQRCHTCNFQHNPDKRAYRPVNHGGYKDRVCQQLCSWRPDSKQCYPGKCTNRTLDNCQCAPDFNGTDCKSITTTPDITSCLATITDIDDEVAEVNCEDVNRTTKYTNILASKLQVDWITQYQGPSGTGVDGSTYPYPYYVQDYDVGVVSAKVDWTISRGNPMSSISNGSIGCNDGISPDSPDKGALSCDDEGTLSPSVISGDMLQFSPKSTNGGRLQINNYDSSATSPTIEDQYYSGSTLTHTASFTFDFDPPYHCLGSCTTCMLERGDAFTKQATFSVSWGGWTDAIAGVKMYQYEVYKFKHLGTGDSAVLDYKTEAPIVSEKVDSLPSPVPSLTLAEPGLYCVLLIVYDDTSDDVLHSNHRLARSFKLFDDSSQVETSDHSDYQMFVNSAAANTSYEWITNLDEQVSVQWTDHFYNDFHRTNFLLNAIAPHSTEIDAEYEERTGQPHEFRSMEAIPNVNGIVRYDLMYALDHDGGRTMSSPSFTWETLEKFLNETESRVISRIDGDSIKFWVKAFDVLNNTLIDEVLVHVDSTAPHIENVGLVRDGEKLLVVHSTVDLFDMVLEFETYDHHSGMKQISWELLDMADLTVHGEGAMAVVRTNAADPTCVAPDFHLIEKDEECFKTTYQITPEQAKLDIASGIHDNDYVYVITVVNNAMLQTVYRFQITIDVSPPLPGHVYDAELGNKDLDYQSSPLVHASWHGFFDRESGIKMYKYAIHTACLAKTDFEFGSSPPAEIATTFNNFASHSLTEGGTYYTTVVAYNHALEPSHPVCSDGVTIDTTPPEVGSIHVSHAYNKPGLVKDSEKMMYRDEEGYVYELEVQTEDCSATTVSDLSLFESRSFPHPIKPHQKNCSSYQSAGGRFYLATENLFEMTWEGSDTESTIHDYLVALSSTDTANGDIISYTSSHGHQYFITYHPNLVNFLEFYVSMKTRNKAGLESIKTIGPFEVRVSGPTFDGDIEVVFEKHDGDDFLVATFGDAVYSSEDVDNDYLSAVEYSLGEGACSGDLISWTVIDNPVNNFGCDNTWPQTCALIDPDVQGFHLHQNTDYCLSVRLEAYNKLVTSSTAWYTHRKSKTDEGLLWEIDTTEVDLVEKDIDYQISTEVLHLRFLQHTHNPDGNHQYLVGVGTTPGNDDIKAFDTVDVTDTLEVDGLKLHFNTQYFATLKIVDLDTDEHSLVQSDGVTVLPENTELPNFMVFDGVTCKKDDPVTDGLLKHHISPEGVSECDLDIDYQPYTTVLPVYWTYEELHDNYIAYFLVSVQEQDRSAEDETWNTILSDYFVGNMDEVQLTGQYLEGGETYRVEVKGCHPAGCYKPKATDGVTILPTEPVKQDITDVVYNVNDTSVTVSWHAFMDPYRGIDFDIISQYAIAIFVRPEHTADLHQITKWIHLKQEEDYTLDPETRMINSTYMLDKPLEASSCLLMAVRGYNGAMLYSTSYKEFLGCTVPDRYNLQIFDAVGERQADGTIGDISLIANDAWLKPEAEYTPSKTSLAAVWPELRHGFMRWSIVSGEYVNRVAYQKNMGHLHYWDFECSSPEVLLCGSTYDRFINIHSLDLEEGARYHVCIYANQTTLFHENWSEDLPEVSVCSNGVTVDITNPLGGLVWVNQQKLFQSDNLVLRVIWASFIDVEVDEHTSHHSGIKTYWLAIGSSYGGHDVLDFLDVGLTNMKTVTGLSLRNGGIYYVTVKAQDHVGLETSVTSEGVTIDITQPIIDKEKLVVSGHYLTKEESIQIFYVNSAFTDPESGVSSYMWCIGSKPNLCDAMSRRKVTDPVLSINTHTGTFVDGQECHVLLEAFNGAGLAVSTIVATFTVDMSDPIGGFVYEIGTEPDADIDYQLSNKDLHLMWGDFSDPESSILEYRLSIGSCQGCTDVLNDVYVGLLKEYELLHLELRPGVKYYSQVQALNSAGLSTTVTSDGITVDRTAPHFGYLMDGIFADDVDYTSKPNQVQAHLDNVHDIQSGLSIISWWVGTSAGDADIFTEEITHSHTVLQKRLDADLSDGTTVYVTVKVCNKAGLCTVKTSDGCTVDTTAPSITVGLELVPTFGTLKSGFQVYRNTMALQWVSSEDISPIIKTYISLLPQDDAHLVLPTVKLTGNPQSYTLAGLDLRDGDCYVAKVTVCNAASLCSQSTSAVWIVDSSPPTSGAFAVDTEHAQDLDRQRDGCMTFDNDGPVVKLAWVGFQDPHSDVLEYSVKIGTGFYTTDIGDITIDHQSSDPHRDEGLVVTETVSISRTLTPNEEIYISIYATNKAGLLGTTLHGLFTAVPSGGATGILELVRRCPALSCVGHCMCAPHGFQGCPVTGNTCTDRTGDSGYATVTVYDTIPSLTASALLDVDYIPSRHILHADWTVGTGIEPNMYDWSVAIKDQAAGSGLLDVNSQRIWYEAGRQTNAVFSMSESKLKDALSPHVSYVFYVKAWYDANNYAIFQSDGVQADSTAPELSNSNSVKETTESDPTSSADMDFTASATEVTVKWEDVFRDGQSGLQSFDVMIYSNKMLSVIKSVRVDGGTELFRFSDLSLTQGEHYVSKVLACNKAGLCTEASSDGFVLDTTAPIPGIVLDGADFQDIQYLNLDHVAFASWQGFYDDESGIDHYVWCVTVGSVQLSCDEVVLYVRKKMSLPEDIDSGEIVSSSVFAVNGAGLSSPVVTSDGFLFDKSPPTEKHHLKFEDSILLNGHFSLNTDDWEIMAKHRTLSDTKLCILNGNIKQTVSTEEYQKYRLQFDVVSSFDSEQSTSLGYIRFGAKEHHIVSAASSDDALHLQQKIYFVMAHSSTTELEFGTMMDTMLCFGDIRLEPVKEGVREVTGSNHPEGSFTSSVHVHVRASSMGTSLILNWDFEDLDTALVDYMYAVGTVQGGIQVQDFKSTGRHTTAALSGLLLHHGTVLHVTVVATNAVGLSTVVYADPIIVDLTTPVIVTFEVNGGNLVLSTQLLNVQWEATDPESGVQSCEFTIETLDADLDGFSTFTWGASGTENVSLPNFDNGDEVSFKLICRSFRDLYTEDVIGLVIYITEASNTENADIYIIPYSESFHHTRGHYLPSANEVWFRWDGIVDPIGVEYCEVTVFDGNNDILRAISLSANKHSTVVLQNGSAIFEYNMPYNLSLACFNKAGHGSKPITTEFYIDPNLPTFTGEALGVFWSSETEVNLNWSGLFSATSQLIYEIQLGTTPGGNDVLSWLETKSPDLDVTDIDSSVTHYLSISAISQNGLYTTHSFVVRY